jgi:endonuclease/exonuclease/phosphatase family metal-dependent hydrolase
MKAVGFKDAVASADVTENREFGSSFNTSNKKLFTDRSHVDHIIVSGTVKVLSAKLFIGGSLFSTSDHLPVVADFEI